MGRFLRQGAGRCRPGVLDPSGYPSRARLAAVLARRWGRAAGLSLPGQVRPGLVLVAAWRRWAAARAAEAWAAWRWESRSPATALASSASRATSIITAAWPSSPAVPARASNRAAARSLFPAGVGGGMRPYP